jgi:hypothetical protein
VTACSRSRFRFEPGATVAVAAPGRRLAAEVVGRNHPLHGQQDETQQQRADADHRDAPMPKIVTLLPSSLLSTVPGDSGSAERYLPRAP